MNKQSGMSFFGVVALVAGIAFVGLLALKLTPPYLANMKIQSALEATATEAETTKMSPHQFISSLNSRLYIDGAHEEIDYAQDMIFEKHDRGVSVVVNYERVVPIMYNVSALLEFDNAVDIEN